MKNSVLTLLLLASATAFANEAADERLNRTAAAGERTRAEVKAQVLQARAQGTLATSDHDGNATQSAYGQRAVSEVRAEAVQAARVRIVHELI